MTPEPVQDAGVNSAARRRSWRLPFVGREQEFASLVARLEATNDSRVVLISGEPGVGKTRLLSEAADYAESLGWRVLTGHAYDSEGMPPYLPFIEALQDYVRTCSTEDLRAQLGAGAGECALILPEVGRRLGDLSVDRQLDPESARYHLYDSVTHFLEAIANGANGGLLLCLDDLHWADDSTLLLLEHLSRRVMSASFLIFATYRTTDLNVGRPLARTLEQLRRQWLSQRIDIKRLSLESVSQMIAGLGRPEPPSSLVETVYSETEGNPYFVEEVFEYLAEEGRLFDAEGGWRSDLQIGEVDVPQGVRLVIGRRLEHLSADSQNVLSTASVLGRTLDFDILRVLADLAEGPLLAALEEAEAGQLLTYDDRGRLTFGHELIRQTLLGNLSGLRRQRLHLRAAEAIEEVHGAAVASHLAEIAGHYRLAGTAAEVEKVIDFCRRAGDNALAVRAYHESIRLYGEAILALEMRTEAPEGRETLIDLRSKRGRAYVSIAKWPEAKRELQTALELLPREATEQRVRLLIEIAVACRWEGDLTSGRRYAEEGRALAESLDRQDLRAGATTSMALLEFSEGDVLGGGTRYQEAIEGAEGTDMAVAKTARAGYAHLLYLCGRHIESVEHGLEGVRLARELGDMATLTFALGPLGLSLAGSGRYDEADQAFADARRVGTEYGVDAYLARAISMSATPHLDLFDFSGAMEIAEEACDLGRRFNFAATIISSAIDRLFIYTRSGDAGAAAEQLSKVRVLISDQATGDSTWLHGWLWSLRLAQLEAEVALGRKDWRTAVSLATASLEASRSKMRRKYEVAALETRAMALVALGKKRDAIADLTGAIEVARLTADPAMLVRITAKTLGVEGTALLAAEGQAAVTRVLAALSDSDMRRRFAEADAVKLISTASGSGLRRVADTNFPDGLSEREVEVLRLIAAGKSNPQIAGELVISLNTVQRHVSNILDKTGLVNRTQAASYAHTHGLV